MILKVQFKEREFSLYINDACIDVMHNIGDINNYIKLKKEYGLENIRKSIVLYSYANYLIIKAKYPMMGKLNYSFNVNGLTYFDELITIEEVELIDSLNCKHDKNICFIDLTSLTVDLI